MKLKLEWEHPYPKRKRYDLAILDTEDTVLFSAADVTEPQLTIMRAFVSSLEAKNEVAQAESEIVP